jgi:phosphoglycolate phosphatase
MAKKVIVFDFDGTLADTADVVVAIFNRLATRFGTKPLDKQDIVLLRNQKSRDIFKSLKVPLLQLPFFIKKARFEFNKELTSVHPIRGIKTTVAKLKKDDYSLGILTSNTESNVQTFLQDHDLNEFDFIYSSSVFGKRKVLHAILKDLKLEPSQVIYIGDETRDIDAAKKAGIKVIAVTWGLNSHDILAQQNPDFLIHEPDELFTVIKNI